MKIQVNNTTLGYDDHGMGLPVIFLHAFPLNRSMWTEQITALLSEQRYRLVALDWRGFGESEITQTLSSMEMFADDVVALMDALGMEQAVLCGLSMGGYAAFSFLRRYPHRLRGLILADTTPDADSEEARANREHLAQVAENQGSSAIADIQVPRLLAEDTRKFQPRVEARVRQMMEAATPTGIAAASRGMALRTEATDLLTGIAIPTLVIVGEQDAVTPVAVAQNYAARIPQAQVATIPGAGHLSNLEQPVIFLDVVRNFLRAAF